MICKCNVLSTGSKGNAVQLEDRILLDCGVPYKTLVPIVRSLNLVLLSHVHSDHFNKAAVRRLAADRPLLRFGCGEWMVLPLVEAGVDPRKIQVFSMGVSYRCNIFGEIFLIEPFTLYHDVPNCGWKITTPGKKKVLYATDTMTMEGVCALDYDLYLIEANHDQDEIRRRAAEKHYDGKFSYEDRAMRTHLSRQQADAWLVENAASFSEILYLHQHQDQEGDGEPDGDV